MSDLRDNSDLPSGLTPSLPELAAEALRDNASNWGAAAWNGGRTERLLAATKRRMVRRQRVYAAGSMMAVAMVLFIVATRVVPLLKPAEVAKAPELGVAQATSGVYAADKEEQKLIRFGDGSLAELASPTAELDVERVSTDAIDINLHKGRGNFRVTPNKGREFTVRAGDVVVTVLGTEFTVEKRDSRTFVKVTRGKVSVDWKGGNRLLLAGEEGQFPPEEVAKEPEPLLPAVVPPATRAIPEVQPLVPEKPIAELYRDRATEQDFDKAYELMKASPTVVGSDASELMLAADVARLSGHPAEAVPFLRRVLKEHTGDSRAPLAAFTLGRMYLGQLGSPGEAAAAFAQVRAMAPGGPLAEDALAREVEARARAGEKGKAQQLAREYLQRYPVGRRTAIVRANGGL
jgi:transmembrane sensor